MFIKAIKNLKQRYLLKSKNPLAILWGSVSAQFPLASIVKNGDTIPGTLNENAPTMRLSRPFRFDPDKGLEILLYVSNRIKNKNIYWVLKTPYFADKYHLQDFGRPVSGDVYYAMKDGPVPGGLYDIVKDVRDSRRKQETLKARSAFRVDDNKIIPYREANPEFLSKSDVRALDRAIAEIGSLPFAKLKKLSHDKAYDKADPNGEIPYDAIIETLPSADLILANS